MKKRILSILLTLVTVFGLLFGVTACGGDEVKMIDYAGQVTLDMNSETLKQEVTVINYIDGDTTHFNVPTSIVENGRLKARYLAINTPESTGKLEEWGKTAARYTREKLETATSIIIETDGAKWETDSTGERYLVWVWYKAPDATDYRNLNLELLQEGLALGSSTAETRYGEQGTAALSQASELKLHIFSNERDPDFFYGEAIELDLKELRLNLKDYVGVRVAFEGVVAQYYNQGVYVESYDQETEMYYGVYVYYGFFLSSAGQKILSEGNRVRIVGNLQYYETGNSYQVSDLKYNPFNLADPNNIQLLDDEKHSVSNTLTTLEQFRSKKELIVNDEERTYDYAELMMNTSITMNDLYVKRAYTTNNDGESDGAISLYCSCGNYEVTVRTSVLKDADGNLVTQDYFVGKTIDVVGIVDYYYNNGSGDYQIQLYSLNDVVVH